MTGDEETVKTFIFKGIGELFRFEIPLQPQQLKLNYGIHT